MQLTIKVLNVLQSLRIIIKENSIVNEFLHINYFSGIKYMELLHKKLTYSVWRLHSFGDGVQVVRKIVASAHAHFSVA